MNLRWIVALVVFLAVGRAEAKMMVHYDLAGLLLEADSVVIADRVQTVTVQGDPRGQYRVVRALRGRRQPGELVEVYDQHYVTRDRAIEARAVLFLGTHDGKPWLVPSGLRVIEKGKVWRFEQHDNPGPFVMVPQGKDPDDQWGSGGAQLDLAGLVRGIADAQQRIDALAAATAITDPAKRRAAILAVFPATRGAGGGFYVDLLAERARNQLAAAGDLEGALLVDLRDAGMSLRARDFAKLPDLVAIAVDRGKSLELRTAALAVAGRGFALTEDFTSLVAIGKLIDDPTPQIRAAAIIAAAHPAGVTTSDQARQRKLDAWTVKIRGAISKRYATETDPRVLAAILETYEGSFRKPPPARTGGPTMVALPTIIPSGVGADVYCLQPLVVDDASIVLRSGATRVPTGWFSIQIHCKGISAVGGPVSGGKPPPAGTYDVAVEVTVKGKPPMSLPLGRVTFDAVSFPSSPKGMAPRSRAPCGNRFYVCCQDASELADFER